jgi:hypothetical protein
VIYVTLAYQLATLKQICKLLTKLKRVTKWRIWVQKQQAPSVMQAAQQCPAALLVLLAAAAQCKSKRL